MAVAVDPTVERVAVALYVSEGAPEECWPTLREDRSSEYDEGPDKAEMRRLALAAMNELEFDELISSFTWAMKRLGELYAFYGADADEDAEAYKKAQQLLEYRTPQRVVAHG